MAHRSFSAVNSLRTCGEQYRLQRIEKVPERPSCPAVAGRVFHTASEHVDRQILAGVTEKVDLFTGAQEVAQTALQEEIASHSEHYPNLLDWKRYGRPTKAKPRGEDMEWWEKEGIPQATENYIDWRLKNPQYELYVLPDGNPAIEVEFLVHVGTGDPIKGFIDRVFVVNGTPLIVDLKTGQKPKTSEQLGVYRKALKAGTGQEFRYGTYLYAIKTELKQIPDIDLSMWTDEKLARIYGTADAVLANKTFMPVPGEHCQHCSVSAYCDFAQAVI